MYLTGYAVECILKALLLASIATGPRRQTAALFRGSRGHDLMWLRDRVLECCGGAIPRNVNRELAYVSSWSTDLRYEPGKGNRDDALRFLTATRIIMDWADGRM
jgi:hypothetical protein